MTKWTLGILGGSGLYDIPGLQGAGWTRQESPWGEPSDDLLIGELHDVRLVFLPRHGRGHRLPPGSVNARANIDVLKRAGCTDVLSISAVGSLRADLAPGMFAVADQYIDRTTGRPSSFFGPGLAAHVSMADPVCPRLSHLVAQAARQAGLTIVEKVTYLAMEGPQFSTRAESRLYRSWGCDLIGMTAMPEAKLAREAELPYANLCMVTDYDCWRDDDARVEVTDVLAVMRQNAAGARRMLARLVRDLPATRAPSPIDSCLDQAVVTDPASWDAGLLAKLDAIGARRFRTVRR